MARHSLILIFLVGCVDVGSSRQSLGIDIPWARHTVHSGLLGADGTDYRDGLIATPWEQSGRVTISGPEGTTEIGLGLSLGAVEDAALADFDGDGQLDVVSASESKKIRVTFSLHNAETITIDAATGVNRWIRARPVDMDNDGDIDILAGGKTSPAVVAWFENVSPREGGRWLRHDISPVSWTMGLEAFDIDNDGDKDVLLSDRQYISSVPRVYSYMGVRWLEQTPAGWINHSIGPVVGQHKMFSLADMNGDGQPEILTCRSDVGFSDLDIRSTQDWLTWVITPIPSVANVGQCQHVTAADFDRDGQLDLAVTYAAADGALSGVVVLRGPNWERIEVSGPEGTKYDNATIVDMDSDGDLDILTSEQTDQLGVVQYENPAPPITPDAAPITPDAAPACSCCALCAAP